MALACFALALLLTLGVSIERATGANDPPAEDYSHPAWQPQGEWPARRGDRWQHSAEESPRWPRNERREFGKRCGWVNHDPSWEHPSWEHPSRSLTRESGPLVSGYLFVAGEYAAPPYLLHYEDRRLLVNGEEIQGLAGSAESSDRQRWVPAMQFFTCLQQALQSGAVVFLENGDDDAARAARITVLPRHDSGRTMLQQLANSDAPRNATAAALSPEIESWLRSYQPSDELMDRAQRDLDLVEFPPLADDFAMMPSIGTWAYPLTVLGMFLAAVAIGQLFINRSLLSLPAETDQAEISRAAVRCIMIVAGLSLLDLVWTLLSLRAGIMQELNPIAATFVHSTLALTSFKIGITFTGAAILYMLRNHRPAQLAAWWLCMVCTLVTVRWVAFTSLFVS